jgi:thioredoxin 1
MMVIEINDQNFESEVLKCEVPVIVDFWAPWCGPCRMITPLTEKLAEKYADKVKFCKLNVDENPNMARKYQVMSIPLLLFFKGGKQVDSVVGLVPESTLQPKVNLLL